jgi:hypothetical protein
MLAKEANGLVIPICPIEKECRGYAKTIKEHVEHIPVTTYLILGNMTSLSSWPHASRFTTSHIYIRVSTPAGGTLIALSGY